MEEQINSIITTLERGASEGTLENAEALDLASRLGSLAASNGVSNTQLIRLIELIVHPQPGASVKCSLPLTVQGKIVRQCLIPNELVSDDCVISIVSCIGRGNLTPLPLKARLLRWIVIVFRYLQNPTIVGRLYGLLFSNLKYETTRQWICHLLFLSTTSKLVRPWRIQILLELYETNKHSSHLLGLLLIYREYAPNLLPNQLPSVSASVFRHPDRYTTSLIKKINRSKLENLTAGNIDRLTHINKRRRVVPGIQSVIGNSSSNSSILIENVNSFSQFVKNIYQLSFPLQMSSVLEDNGFLNNLMMYKEDSLSHERLNTWLSNALFHDRNNPSELKYLLRRIATFVDSTKILPIAVEEFLLAFLSTWKNNDRDDELLGLFFTLLSHLPLLPANVITTKIFDPLTKIIDGLSISLNLLIFQFIHSLLFNWNIKYQQVVEQGEETIEDLNQIQIQNALQSIIDFTDKSGLSLLELTNDDCIVQDKLLKIYELLPTLCLSKVTPKIIMISHLMACRLIFAPSSQPISRLCALLVTYRELCSESGPHDPAVARFNSLVLDLCNILWRDKGFSESANSNRFGLDPLFITQLDKLCLKNKQSLATLFNITNSPLFILIAMLYLRVKENELFTITEIHKGQITNESFTKENWLEITYDDFRLELLDKFEIAGFSGIGQLLFTSLRSLMERKLNA